MGSILRFQGLGLGFGLRFRVVTLRIPYMWVYIRLAYVLTTRVTQLNRSAKHTRALSLIFSYKQRLRLRSPKLRSYFASKGILTSFTVSFYTPEPNDAWGSGTAGTIGGPGYNIEVFCSNPNPRNPELEGAELLINPQCAS